MDYFSLFKMPKQIKITGRSSSITNVFISSIIPVITPTENQVKQALDILEMSSDNFQCSYCGSSATEWDHLRPLVKDKKPTGYISEIHNLVPSCGKCNQSKGNKYWKDWMLSSAKLSPKSKAITNLEEKVKRLEEFESWDIPTKIDFEKIVGSETWQQHWENCEQVQKTMCTAQTLAEKIKVKIIINFRKL